MERRPCISQSEENEVEERTLWSRSHLEGEDHKFSFREVDFEVYLGHPRGAILTGQREDTVAMWSLHFFLCKAQWHCHCNRGSPSFCLLY